MSIRFEGPPGILSDDFNELSDIPVDDVVELENDVTCPTMRRIDLGPEVESYGVDLGPRLTEEAELFEDANDSRYIYKGTIFEAHCMDDRVTKLGLQLPGGLVETRLMSRMMSERAAGLPLSQRLADVLADLQSGSIKAFVHAGCGAGTYKRDALRMTAKHDGVATDFTLEIMDALKVPCDAEAVRSAIIVGESRAENDVLWDSEFDDELNTARHHEGIGYEEFSYGHRAAGLRIDVTNFVFNNALFRRDHKIADEEVGLLSVNLGAYKKLMQEARYPADVVGQELMHATLATFGATRVLGHEYMPAAIISSRG